MVEKAEGLVSAEQTADLGAMVFETYGHPLIEAGNWSAAAAIYAEGLANFPDDYVLKTNALYVAQQWRSAAFAEGGSKALDTVNTTLAGLLPTFDQTDGEDAIRRQIADPVQVPLILRLRRDRASARRLTHKQPFPAADAQMARLNPFLRTSNGKMASMIGGC